MSEDAEGFLYPKIDPEQCIECGNCERICPVIHRRESKKPNWVYASQNPDEAIRLASSSGGIFTLLAERIIQENGTVFGVRFNENKEVIHDYTETIDGLAAFRGSKYVQSNTGETYRRVKNFLELNRKVLYTGTPCQIAGLKSFLRQDHENLLTVDIVCHGVPSPAVWRRYSGSCHLPSGIEKEAFKGGGVFVKGFLNNIYLRPSCYACPVKPLRSGSDITIGDYFGIKNIRPLFYDTKGISLVLIHSVKGYGIYRQLKKKDRETDYYTALFGNKCIEKSVAVPIVRAVFFQKWKTEDITRLISKLIRFKPHHWFKKKISKLLTKILQKLSFAIWTARTNGKK
jgi:ferredoxin